MDTVIHAEEKFSEKRRRELVDRLLGEFEQLNQAAVINGQTFAELAESDLLEAISRLPEFIEKTRNINPGRSFVEAVAGGPNQDWIVPLFNVVGEFYPELERDVRKSFLRQCLRYLDQRNYFEAQNHVEMLEDPMLIADVIINRSLYWPGFRQFADLLRTCRTKDELVQVPDYKLGSFWTCLAVMWNGDWITLPLRQWYYQNYADLLDRSLCFAAAKTHTRVERMATESELQFFDCVTTYLNERFDSTLHDRIQDRMKQKKWILLEE